MQTMVLNFSFGQLNLMQPNNEMSLLQKMKHTTHFLYRHRRPPFLVFVSVYEYVSVSEVVVMEMVTQVEWIAGVV